MSVRQSNGGIGRSQGVRVRIVSVGSSGPMFRPGVYVREYHPDVDGGRPVFTDDLDEALVLPMGEWLTLYRQPSTREPLRLDGRPNRPLTAFTVEFETVETCRLCGRPRIAGGDCEGHC
jgi:hypothetical protein